MSGSEEKDFKLPAGKGPYMASQMDLGDEEEPSTEEGTVEEVPLDLEWFFDYHGVPLEERVKMCSTYATYLRTRLRGSILGSSRKRSKQ